MRSPFRYAAVLVAMGSLVVSMVVAACDGRNDTGVPDEAASSTSTSEPSVTTTEEVRILTPESLGGLGDEYYPQAGNAGYDALHYEIVLECDPEMGALEGTTTMQAEALADLDLFHLDLVGLQVGSVSVDGTTVEYEREGQELIVECIDPLEAGDVFSVTVAYSGTPEPKMSEQEHLGGWQIQGDTVFTSDEPEGAATWYPLNDHPSDKATYEFRLTVPKPYLAVASATLTSTLDNGEDRTFIWEMDYPMANYLSAVVIGDLVLQEEVSSDGVPIRNYFDPGLTRQERELFADTGEMIDFFATIFGPYPFDVYGVVVPDITFGGGMEHQTMTLFGRDVVGELVTVPLFGDILVSHELAHMWFGDSVTLAEWQDIWLNEGFATYASWLWLEHDLGKIGLDAAIELAYEFLGTDETPPGDPGVAELFGGSVYERGALTLHALRLLIGDDLFFQILREWAAEHAYGNATTEDFTGLVEQKTAGVEGFDVEEFFDTWLFQEELPELPDV